MICWLNGQLLEAENAHIAITDRGFLLGDGLYETIRVSSGQAQCLTQHLARLRTGADIISLPPLNTDIEAAITAVLQANRLQEGSLRLTVARGSGPRGLAPPTESRPTVLITAFPASAALPPAHLIIANSTCRNEQSPLAGVKSINCLDNIIARREAQTLGADDAILINTAGRIAEATAANIFAVIDNALLTPPLSDGALPGITRARVLVEGGREASLTADDLKRAQEIFLTSSLGIRQVCKLAGRVLPDDKPISTRLTGLLFGG
ncbi:aminotransferase class IV [Pseudochelatococcus sp. G4_1912]|uniref:aminotransferase class IV n=1 Tax=Pseudochelatococcus sp. G4_1912 TaxID=3114288 RepID=UPI0039C6C8A5